MKEKANIQYVTRNQLDTNRWNSCIDHAGAYPIYAYTFYLDAMCRQWDALVMNDYEAVMPLAWNKKMGIYYLYQPFLTPQLGIAGCHLSKEVLYSFLKAIPERFTYWEINLNKNNVYDLKGLELKNRVNFTLSLQKSYSDITTHYNSNLKRNLKKAISAGCEYKEGIPIHDVIQLAEQQLRQYTRVKSADISQFTALCKLLLYQHKAQTAGIYNNGLLCAACIFFFHGARAYYILASTHTVGRQFGASHFLLDQFIKNRAGQNLILDFVGSDISSIAFFYKSFGGQPEYYPSIKLNRLPWWLRWIKE